MTRTDTKEHVSLSPGTWVALIGLCVTLVSVVVSTSWSLQGRITSTENRLESHERRLDDGDTRDKELRNEILAEIRLLRQELKGQ